MLNLRPLDFSIPSCSRAGEAVKLIDNSLLVDFPDLFMLQVPFECRVMFGISGRNEDERDAVERDLAINLVRPNFRASEAAVEDVSKPSGIELSLLLKF